MPTRLPITTEPGFREAIERALPGMRHLLEQYLPGSEQREEREDILQQTIQDAWRIRDRYDRGKAQFSTWICTMLIRDCKNAVVTRNRLKRGGGRKPVSLDSLEDHQREAMVPRWTDSPDLRKTVPYSKGWKHRLTPIQRECVRRVCMGEAYKQIGVALGCAPTSVGTHIETAKRKLGAKSLPHLAALYTAAGMLDVKPPGIPPRVWHGIRGVLKRGTSVCEEKEAP